MKLGDLIKQRRETAGMSLQDVADAVGATKGYIWEIENGKTVNIGLLLAVRLSVALAIPVNALAASALETQPWPPQTPDRRSPVRGATAT